MEHIYDVIISGCGPSGSLLGSLLASSGINTLILEKKFFPREKTCGGGLQHRALNLLPFDASSFVNRSIQGIYFSFKNNSPVLKRYDRPIMYTVLRSGFDEMLSSYAIKKGCRIEFGKKVESYEVSKSGVCVYTKSKKYKSKILIGADGVRGTVHKCLIKNKTYKKILGYEVNLDLFGKIKDRDGTDGPVDPKYIIKDSRGFIFDLKDNIRLDFHGVKKGYCWLFPKTETVSCGIGSPVFNPAKTRNYLKSFISGFYEDSHQSFEKLKINAHGIPVATGREKIFDYRVLAIGDAACLGDGFTGEGIYNSFKSSFIAHDCIIGALKNSDFVFDDYNERIKMEILGDIKASLLFTKVFYSSLNIFYRMLVSDGGYFNTCCKILRGEKSYGDIVRRLKLSKLLK